MSTTTYTVYMKLAYENSDFTRELKFADVKASVISGVETAVQNFNSNVTAQEKNIFIADDYDGTNGKLDKIAEARVETLTETIINLGGN